MTAPFTPPSDALAATTAVFAAALGPQIAPAAVRRMAEHWLLVTEANARHNLTGIRDAETAAQVHYRDACCVADLLRPGSLVDFGSGGGFPGLIFAALAPERLIALVEPRRLRANFLREAVAALDWQQVAVHQCKLQAEPPQRFANAVSRAVFASDADLAGAARWLLPGGRLLSFRARTAPTNDRAGALYRQTSRAYDVAGSARRVDVWELGASGKFV